MMVINAPGVRDGRKSIEKKLPPKGGFKLKEMQEIVGGYIEIVSLDGGMIMVVNEEGLLKRLPPNVIASELAGRVIVGSVLVCREKDVK